MTRLCTPHIGQGQSCFSLSQYAKEERQDEYFNVCHGICDILPVHGNVDMEYLQWTQNPKEKTAIY